MKRIGSRTFSFSSPPTVLGHAAVGGKKEAEGPLSGFFAQLFTDERLYTDSFEKAEAQLQREAVNLALDKSKLSASDIDMIFAGDLLDQCIASSYGLIDYGIPFLGQYGACSTMAQTLLMASMAVDSGAAERAVAVTSSHFCSAERQFRSPLEYGSQRTPTAQWTATASGCAVIGVGGKIEIAEATPGKIVDLGVKDPANMGAAMAPAVGIIGQQARFFQRYFSGQLHPWSFNFLYTLNYFAAFIFQRHHGEAIVIEKTVLRIGQLATRLVRTALRLAYRLHEFTYITSDIALGNLSRSLSISIRSAITP